MDIIRMEREGVDKAGVAGLMRGICGMAMQGGKADNRNQAGTGIMGKKIKVNIFEDLREALQDVRAYERGEDVNLRVTHFPSAPK